MKKPWSFLQNPFLNCTAKSFRKALRISAFHDAALYAAKTDPFFSTLYNSFHPTHTAYQTAYSTWKAKLNAQQGATLTVELLIDSLSNTKVKAWHIAVQMSFPDTTSQYKAIFPNNRSPFQKGSQTDRLTAVKTLSTALTGISALANTKTDVDNFYTSLENALTAQKGSISATENSSDLVEAARIVMCTAQYANLGAMIQKYAANPDIIGNYFDLKAIRQTTQTFYRGQLKAGERHLVVKHTFKTDDELTLDNPGNTELRFWLGASKDEAIGAQFTSVPAGEAVTLLASELGSLSKAFLLVQNSSPTAEGEFEVEI